MPDPVDFYRAMYGNVVTTVAAKPEAAPVAHSEQRVHEKHGGESLARQRKAAAGKGSLSAVERYQRLIADFSRLDHQKRSASFYVGHVGLD